MLLYDGLSLPGRAPVFRLPHSSASSLETPPESPMRHEIGVVRNFPLNLYGKQPPMREALGGVLAMESGWKLGSGSTVE